MQLRGIIISGIHRIGILLVHCRNTKLNGMGANEQQLTQLITALSNLIVGLSQPNSQPSPDEIIATQNLVFEPFDKDKESFLSYRQRIDNFFACK